MVRPTDRSIGQIEVYVTPNYVSHVPRTFIRLGRDSALWKEPLNVSLIVPVRNEGGNLPSVLPLIPKIPEISEVIIVDGHSWDDSVEVARKLLPNAKIVTQQGDGKGNAILYGSLVARGNLIAVLDSDGSNDPLELPSYLDYVRKGFDLVKGSRYMSGGRSYDETAFRKFLIVGAQFVANTLWRSKFTDISYGMFVADREKMLALSLQSKRHDVEWELMGKAHRMGFFIIEVPSVEQKRISGKSNVKIVYDGLLIVKTVLKEFFERIRNHRGAPVSQRLVSSV